MKKMSDVFDMSKSIGYNANWSDDQVRAADKAILMHDELVSALEEARVYVEEQEYINGYDRIFLHKIDSLLERCK